ncbi:MAG TPA: HupE/UreJ family protein [Steroidobacteraceae bacterium]|nr:HupE/UreJ family protein [Steroidobacteraceae bacterium]
MRKPGVWRCCLVFLLCAAGTAAAHEVRPASLEITELPGATQILWRQPLLGGYSLALTPRLSSGWLDAPATQQTITAQSLTRGWRIAPPQPLAGQTLRIEGLDSTLTDVFVRVHWRNGDETVALLKPLDNSIVLKPQNGSGAALGEYFHLGIEHIWTGYDHLLYLLGLMLLAGSLRALLGVITAFTAAHSLTLALSVLGIVKLPPAPVDASIALSILFVAVELRRGQLGRPGYAHAHPWVVAFAFGLLHGFGFATVLRSVGLPDGQIAAPLLLFNLGIEAGQIAFVASAGALFWLLVRRAPAAGPALRRALPLAIGSLAGWWFIERAIALG